MTDDMPPPSGTPWNAPPPPHPGPPGPAYPPPTGPPLGYQVAPEPPAREAWWRQTRVTMAVVVVLVGGGIGFFVWEGLSKTNVAALTLGACIDVPSDASFEKVDDAACSEPHDAEVVGFLPYVAGFVDGIGECETKALEFLGGTKGLERYRYNAIIVRDASKTVCLIETTDGSKLTSSLNGAGQ